MMEDYKKRIGKLILETRKLRNLTQNELAEKLGTSQSAINRIEAGKQNVSLSIIAKISEVLSSDIIRFNPTGEISFKIHGGNKLHGSIKVNTSKNAAVALLCASLLNKSSTVLKRVAKIEEVYRIIEVLNSIGVKTKWINKDKDLEITPPKELNLDGLNEEAAKKTRSVIMLFGPLLHYKKSFKLPYAGGCNLGKRTIEPHLQGLKHFGLDVKITKDHYEAKVSPTKKDVKIVLSERGDTVTENILMAAALSPYKTTIVNASSNYMVQDLCFYLMKLGVKISGLGTTKLEIIGKNSIAKRVEYAISEDPIEAMSFIAAGITTKSELEIKRCPIDFLEVELQTLRNMGQKLEISEEYLADNNATKLVDIKIFPSDLTALKDKIAPMPYPGLNIDNLPFFALIAASASGRTLIHDWVYENRTIYLTELTKLNVDVELVDPHRIFISGCTKWKPTEIITPPALRPAVVIMLGMLAANGTSILRNIYSINRGYEDFANRLNSLGANIEIIRDI